MKLRFLILLLLLLFLGNFILLAQEVAINNPGNGTITVKQYCSFLNEVASSDPHDLYEEIGYSNQIIRFGKPGNYCYKVASSTPNVPMLLMSKLDAEQYCHWLEGAAPTSIFPTTDKQLKSNQLTFRSVSIEANAYQAGGAEIVGAEEIDAEIAATLAWIVSMVEGPEARQEHGFNAGDPRLLEIGSENDDTRFIEREKREKDQLGSSFIREQQLASEQNTFIEHARSILNAHPRASRFIIKNEEGITILQAQDNITDANGRNRSENKETIDFFRQLLPKNIADELLQYRGAALGTQIDPLDAQRLRNILNRWDTHAQRAAINLKSQNRDNPIPNPPSQKLHGILTNKGEKLPSEPTTKKEKKRLSSLLNFLSRQKKEQSLPQHSLPKDPIEEQAYMQGMLKAITARTDLSPSLDYQALHYKEADQLWKKAFQIRRDRNITYHDWQEKERRVAEAAALLEKEKGKYEKRGDSALSMASQISGRSVGILSLIPVPSPIGLGGVATLFSSVTGFTDHYLATRGIKKAIKVTETIAKEVEEAQKKLDLVRLEASKKEEEALKNEEQSSEREIEETFNIAGLLQIPTISSEDRWKEWSTNLIKALSIPHSYIDKMASWGMKESTLVAEHVARAWRNRMKASKAAREKLEKENCLERARVIKCEKDFHTEQQLIEEHRVTCSQHEQKVTQLEEQIDEANTTWKRLSGEIALLESPTHISRGGIRELIATKNEEIRLAHITKTEGEQTLGNLKETGNQLKKKLQFHEEKAMDLFKDYTERFHRYALALQRAFVAEIADQQAWEHFWPNTTWSHETTEPFQPPFEPVKALIPKRSYKIAQKIGYRFFQEQKLEIGSDSDDLIITKEDDPRLDALEIYEQLKDEILNNWESESQRSSNSSKASKHSLFSITSRTFARFTPSYAPFQGVPRSNSITSQASDISITNYESKLSEVEEAKAKWLELLYKKYPNLNSEDKKQLDDLEKNDSAALAKRTRLRKKEEEATIAAERQKRLEAETERLLVREHADELHQLADSLKVPERSKTQDWSSFTAACHKALIAKRAADEAEKKWEDLAISTRYISQLIEHEGADSEIEQAIDHLKEQDRNKNKGAFLSKWETAAEKYFNGDILEWRSLLVEDQVSYNELTKEANEKFKKEIQAAERKAVQDVDKAKKVLEKIRKKSVSLKSKLKKLISSPNTSRSPVEELIRHAEIALNREENILKNVQDKNKKDQEAIQLGFKYLNDKEKNRRKYTKQLCQKIEVARKNFETLLENIQKTIPQTIGNFHSSWENIRHHREKIEKLYEALIKHCQACQDDAPIDQAFWNNYLESATYFKIYYNLKNFWLLAEEKEILVRLLEKAAKEFSYSTHLIEACSAWEQVNREIFNADRCWRNIITEHQKALAYIPPNFRNAWQEEIDKAILRQFTISNKFCYEIHRDQLAIINAEASWTKARVSKTETDWDKAINLWQLASKQAEVNRLTAEEGISFGRKKYELASTEGLKLKWQEEIENLEAKLKEWANKKQKHESKKKEVKLDIDQEKEQLSCILDQQVKDAEEIYENALRRAISTISEESSDLGKLWEQLFKSLLFVEEKWLEAKQFAEACYAKTLPEFKSKWKKKEERARYFQHYYDFQRIFIVAEKNSARLKTLIENAKKSTLIISDEIVFPETWLQAIGFISQSQDTWREVVDQCQRQQQSIPTTWKQHWNFFTEEVIFRQKQASHSFLEAEYQDKFYVTQAEAATNEAKEIRTDDAWDKAISLWKRAKEHVLQLKERLAATIDIAQKEQGFAIPEIKQKWDEEITNLNYKQKNWEAKEDKYEEQSEILSRTKNWNLAIIVFIQNLSQKVEETRNEKNKISRSWSAKVELKQAFGRNEELAISNLESTLMLQKNALKFTPEIREEQWQQIERAEKERLERFSWALKSPTQRKFELQKLYDIAQKQDNEITEVLLEQIIQAPPHEVNYPEALDKIIASQQGWEELLRAYRRGYGLAQETSTSWLFTNLLQKNIASSEKYKPWWQEASKEALAMRDYWICKNCLWKLLQQINTTASAYHHLSSTITQAPEAWQEVMNNISQIESSWQSIADKYEQHKEESSPFQKNWYNELTKAEKLKKEWIKKAFWKEAQKAEEKVKTTEENIDKASIENKATCWYQGIQEIKNAKQAWKHVMECCIESARFASPELHDWWDDQKAIAESKCNTCNILISEWEANAHQAEASAAAVFSYFSHYPEDWTHPCHPLL